MRATNIVVDSADSVWFYEAVSDRYRNFTDFLFLDYFDGHDISPVYDVL
jgi:hypothetical protein